MIGDETLHQGRRSRRELARLEHDAVSGSKRRCHRQHRELKRIIPRTDHADHPHGLAYDPASSWPQVNGCRHAAWSHPSFETATRIPDSGAHREELRDPRLLCRPRAEVGRDHANDFGFVLLRQRGQPIQPITPHRDRWIRLTGKRRPLCGEERIQRVVLAGAGERGCVHPITPAKGVIRVHAALRAAFIVSSNVSGSCAPDTAVRPLKMKKGTALIPLSFASRFSATTISVSWSESSTELTSAAAYPASWAISV